MNKPYRHKPGCQCRVKNLEMWVAEDPSSNDPFSGNYTIVPQENLVVTYPSINGVVTAQPYTLSKNSDGTYSIQQGQQFTWESADLLAAPRYLCSIAADFDGDGRAELAMVYFTETAINLAIVTYEPTTESLAKVSSASLQEHVSINLMRIATWVVNESTLLVVGYVTDKGLLSIDVFDLSQGAALLRSTTVPIVNGGQFDLVTGDFYGDGIEYLAVAWQGIPDSQNNNLFLCLYTLKVNLSTNQSLVSLLETPKPIALMKQQAFLSLGGGAMLPGNPSQDQIVVSWADESGNACLSVWTLKEDTKGTVDLYNLSWFSSKEEKQFHSLPYPLILSNLGVLKVAVHDFDLDGVEEIVLGAESTVGTITDALVLRAFRLDSNGTLNQTDTGIAKSVDGTSMVAVDLDLRGGALVCKDEILNALIVGLVGTDSISHTLKGIGMVTIGLIQMNPSLQFPPQMQSSSGQLPSSVTFNGAQAPNLNIKLLTSLGDYSGKSIRVGSPGYFRIEKVNGLIAVINAPPVQKDISTDGSYSVSFQTQKQETTSLSLQVNRTWTASDTLNVNLSLSIISVRDSINRTYGENFSKSTSKIDSLTTGLCVTASNDDILLMLVTDYDVWEYPVYDSTGNTPSGNILVVWPRFPYNSTAITEGLAYDCYYIPRHQVQQLLSYQIGSPNDFDQKNAFYCGNIFTVGINQTQATIDWSKGKTTNNSSNVSLNITKDSSLDVSNHFNFLGGCSLGLSADFSDNYTYDKTSTYEVSIQESTTINILFGQLNDISTQYKVEPILYWSNQGQQLTLDYNVSFVPGSYWNKKYQEPAPNFYLPWMNAQDEEYTYLTRCIDPQVQQDGTVKIVATIINFGLSEANGVTAQFYLGDPSKGGIKIGNSMAVAPIPPRGQQTCSTKWTSTDPKQDYKLYCELTWIGANEEPVKIKGFNMYPPDYFSKIQNKQTRQFFLRS